MSCCWDYVIGDVLTSLPIHYNAERKRAAWESCHRRGGHPPSLRYYEGGRRSTRDYYAKCLSVSGWVFRASAIYLRVLYSWDCVSRSVVARRQAYSSLRRVTRLSLACCHTILALTSSTYSFDFRVCINRLRGAPTVTLLPNVVQLILLLKCFSKLLLAVLGAPGNGNKIMYLWTITTRKE